jgi:hypothetical protein
MDGTTGSGEAVGDDGASSRRVVNSDSAADRCAARRGSTDGGGMRQRRRGRARPGHTGQGTDDGRTHGATSMDARRWLHLHRRLGTVEHNDGELLRSKARCGLVGRVAALAGRWSPHWLAGRRAERSRRQGPRRERGREPARRGGARRPSRLEKGASRGAAGHRARRVCGQRYGADLGAAPGTKGREEKEETKRQGRRGGRWFFFCRNRGSVRRGKRLEVGGS